jgi:hypothetical protein
MIYLFDSDQVSPFRLQEELEDRRIMNKFFAFSGGLGKRSMPGADLGIAQRIR